MGTATFTISGYGPKYHGVAGKYVTSGAHTTSTSASSLTDGAAGAGSAITGRTGDVLTIQVDEAARVMFGDETATATVGHIIYASTTRDLEITGPGAISIIDIA